MNTNYLLIGALKYTLENKQSCVGARQTGEVQGGRGDALADTRTKRACTRKEASVNADRHLLACPPNLKREAMPRFVHPLPEGLRIAEESWSGSSYHSVSLSNFARNPAKSCIYSKCSKVRNLACHSSRTSRRLHR
jgi:hypothetical protein